MAGKEWLKNGNKEWQQGMAAAEMAGKIPIQFRREFRKKTVAN